MPFESVNKRMQHFTQGSFALLRFTTGAYQWAERQANPCVEELYLNRNVRSWASHYLEVDPETMAFAVQLHPNAAF